MDWQMRERRDEDLWLIERVLLYALWTLRRLHAQTPSARDDGLDAQPFRIASNSRHVDGKRRRWTYLRTLRP